MDSVLARLSPPRGAVAKKKRVGRGPGSGLGKTAGRGVKGQGSRSGGVGKRGFEGGQMPLVRRLPKRGFWNPFRVESEILNVADLARVSEKNGEVEWNPRKLAAVRLVSAAGVRVKVLGDGEIGRPVNVAAHAFSKSAVKKIEAAGGKVVWLEPPRPPRPKFAPPPRPAPEEEAPAEEKGKAKAKDAAKVKAKDKDAAKAQAKGAEGRPKGAEGKPKGGAKPKAEGKPKAEDDKE